jgi:putative flavoprotein involved in K+ transport
MGVELAGRVTDIDQQHVNFKPDLAANVAAAQLRLRKLLSKIDRHIDDSGLASEVLDPEPQQSLTVTEHLHRLDLRDRGITSVIWATGHRRSYPWLRIPILDEHGEIRQHRGVTPLPGLYVLGQRFQYHRNSNFIDGVGRDAEFVADHLVSQRAARLSPA